MDVNAKDSLRAFRVLSPFMPEYVGQQLDNQHFLMQKVCKQVLILAAYEKYNQEQIIILRKVDKRMLIEKSMLTRFRNTRNTYIILGRVRRDEPDPKCTICITLSQQETFMS